MEEIREIASAYYADLSEELKKDARTLFKSVDSNDDGRLTVDEFAQLFRDKHARSQTVLQILNSPSFFKELDENQDGFLNFKEFIVFYYLFLTRRLNVCYGHGCGAFLKGMFFACPFCFHDTEKPFVICLACYRKKNYNHDHPILLDNYALLTSSRAFQNSPPSSDKPSGTISQQTRSSDKPIEFSRTPSAQIESRPSQSGKELKRQSRTSDMMQVTSKVVTVASTGYEIGSLAAAVGIAIATGACSIL